MGDKSPAEISDSERPVGAPNVPDPTMDEDEQIFESRRMILDSYKDNTLQYGGYVLSLAIALFAEISLIHTTYQFVIYPIISATAVGGIYCVLMALFWGAMSRSIGEIDLPSRNEINRDYLVNLQGLYVEKMQKTNIFPLSKMTPKQSYFLHALVVAVVVAVIVATVSLLSI